MTRQSCPVLCTILRSVFIRRGVSFDYEQLSEIPSTMKTDENVVRVTDVWNEHQSTGCRLVEGLTDISKTIVQRINRNNSGKRKFCAVYTCMRFKRACRLTFVLFESRWQQLLKNQIFIDQPTRTFTVYLISSLPPVILLRAKSSLNLNKLGKITVGDNNFLRTVVILKERKML